MKYVDELKVIEIAQKLGKTFKSVEADLYRARQAFIRLYSELEKHSETTPSS
jgi:DNA-directed RNA polymerase specialized sigma24 family protein